MIRKKDEIPMSKHSTAFCAAIAVLSLALPVAGCMAGVDPDSEPGEEADSEPVGEAEEALGGDCAAENNAVIVASNASLACHAANPNRPECCCGLDDAFLRASCQRDMCVVREAGGTPSQCPAAIVCSLQPRCRVAAPLP